MYFEYISKLLDKIADKDPHINAFIEVYRDDALAKAKELDKKANEGKKLGKLAGKAIAVKNNIAIKGRLLSCASKMLENYIAPYNAHVIERIIAEDGIIIGSTNLDEFACGSDNTHSAFFKTKNPLDSECVPGGTSGGSAAAIAANFADIALGSDTGGSIRCPASFCGVVGIKPTYGLVSRYGLADMSMSLDQIGVLAQNVNDAKLMLSIIAGRDERDQTTHSTQKHSIQKHLIQKHSVQGYQGYPIQAFELEYHCYQKPTIAIAKEFLDGLDEKIADIFHVLVEKLKSEGYEISEVSIPAIKHAIPIYYLTVFAEFSSAMQKYDGLRYGETGKILENFVEDVSDLRGDKFGLEVKRRILLGTFITTKEYSEEWCGKTLKARGVLKKEIETVFNKYDLLLGPTMSTLPWKFGEKSNPIDMYLADILTAPANLAGLPAGSVPFGKIGKFKPGMQVLGNRFEEGKVFALMKKIEELC
ncbi:MAG: Asp-tRNA(Asn)/Glu-tRNA(Gln) amidotransferase subunit GatA [Candidatus Micrarchaeota archaeon]